MITINSRIQGLSNIVFELIYSKMCSMIETGVRAYKKIGSSFKEKNLQMFAVKLPIQSSDWFETILR
jgi:hypothetical protein